MTALRLIAGFLGMAAAILAGFAGAAALTGQPPSRPESPLPAAAHSSPNVVTVAPGPTTTIVAARTPAPEDPGESANWMQGRGGLLSRQAAAQDIRFALARAEAIHPRLFWNADRSRVLARAESLIAALPAQPTAMDVYVNLSELVGMLGDGHVSLSRPPGERGDLLLSYAWRGGHLLAVRVRPAAGGLEVLHSNTDGVKTGDLLTGINGFGAAALFARAAALSPGEAGFQERLTEIDFFERLWDLGIQPRFTLDGRFAGTQGRIEVEGWSRRDGPLDRRPAAEDGVRLTPLPDGIYVVAIDRLTVLRDKFQRRLATVFAQIAMANASGLIIDIRQNGGGLTSLAEDVLDYITDKPHRLFARVLVRASAECRGYLPKTAAGAGPAGAMASMPDGDMRSWQVAVHAPRAEATRFAGPVAVLIGPGTFSAANALANAISDFHLATLIGHDTAEIPNNYGNACPLVLPNTGMTLRVPSMYSVRANGDEMSREDVHADIETPPTPDQDGAEDLDVAVARDWILGQRRSTAGVYRPTSRGYLPHT